MVTGKLHWLHQARENGNHPLTDLLSTNQHIPLNVNEEEEAILTLSTLCPCLIQLCRPQPHYPFEYVPLFPFLPFLQLAFSSTSHMPMPLSVDSGFSGCDACGSAGTCLEPACCSSARSPIVSPSFLSSLGHMVWPKGKSELLSRQREHALKCTHIAIPLNLRETRCYVLLWVEEVISLQ